MKYILRNSYLLLLLTLAQCSTSRIANKPVTDDGKIEVVFVQVNDVYEIAPLAAGKEGGMARVATIKKTYQQQNPNTFLVMAGDFLSPSVYNSLKYQGVRIRGKQMVEAMNAAGMTFAIFGNHEFDISETELQQRIDESGFTWIASNTFHKTTQGQEPFSRTNVRDGQFERTFIMQVKDADGTTARIGFMGLTLPFNKAPYVTYTDPIATAKSLYNRFSDSVDAVIAITHQSIEDDERLAREIPGLALIMGGHEHDMRFKKIGNIYITKAHANAKSAYILKMRIDKNKHTHKVDPQLKYLDESVAIDSNTNKVVQKWVDIANENYASLGFDARKVVMQSGEPLDGREVMVRSQPTNLTRLIVKSMEFAAPNADAAILNAGSIRVDDVLPMPITQYDVIRSLPFGGGIKVVDMKGSLLKKILDAGVVNKTTGGYLLLSESVENPAAVWQIGANKIEDGKVYTIAMTDFLLTGGESNLDFLTEKNPNIIKVHETTAGSVQSDVRLAVVKYLESLH